MTRSHFTSTSPSGVPKVIEPAGSTLIGEAEYMQLNTPFSIESVISETLPSLARANSSRRLTMMTLFCLASATAFSIAASPAPMTMMVSASYSSGSSS